MNKEQFIKKLVPYDCFGVLNNIAKDYNEAVTRFTLHGDNTFTPELLISMVRGNYNCSAAQIEAIAFCYCRILEKNSTEQQPTNYVPELTYDWSYWAIDSTGHAFYYKAFPTLREKMWVRNKNAYGMKMDENFDASNYKHMWQNNAWKTSVVSLEAAVTQKIYTPVFPEDKTAWAIDDDGAAYFYREESPERGSNTWRSNKHYHMDDNFDADKYPHMWKNGAWQNSLKTK